MGTMNEESILKRTLLLTGKLVGIFSIWVALLSVIATVAAGRMVVALSGATVDRGALLPTEDVKKDDAAGTRGTHPSVSAKAKPNG